MTESQYNLADTIPGTIGKIVSKTFSSDSRWVYCIEFKRLAYEYPEAVRATMTSPIRGFTPIIGWLAGQHETALQENKYKLSVAHQLSIQISDYTRAHARAIINLELRITDNQDRMLEILKVEQFQPYLRVFNRFGFGVDNKILLLYHIYPFEKFLQGGKPLIEHELNDQDKLQKRDRSLRKFHGSSIARSHLYAWAVCMVAPKNSRINSDIGKQLSDRP